jgi:phosphotransferase system enzyme I (PtsI)
MQRLIGIGVSSGVVSGRAVVLFQRSRVFRYRIAEGRVEAERQRLEQGRDKTRQQLANIRERLARSRGRELAALFDAQILMLDDPLLVHRALELVRSRQVNAEWAVEQVFEELSALFDEMADPYLRERKGDVADLVGRLVRNLRKEGGTARDLLGEVDDASILVADELTPSLAGQIDWNRIKGLVTDAGSPTYHTAILARSLEVPAVVGLHDASAIIQPGQLLVIDAAAGEVIVEPDAETLARAERGAREARPPSDEVDRRGPATTADGVRIRLDANIEFADDLAAARYAGAEGIGLYRSEFLLTGGEGGASEDEQYDVYRRMLEDMAPGPVTIRTFDVDEESLAARGQREAIPWNSETRTGRQGLRGLRLSLTHPELFQTQLRALLRAACHGSLRVLFPFVSSVEQVRAARRALAVAAGELGRRGERAPAVPVGVMIEIPAAAYTADLLAPEVDFFTIGTNDLIQYCLAVDRSDDRVSDFYAPLHPAVLRLIMMVRRASSRHRVPLSLCGEMASDPMILTLLVGLGLRDFSMTPGAIGMARKILAEVRVEELRPLARRVLRLATVAEIEQALEGVLGRVSETRK